MTNWILLSAGALLAGLLIGRSLLTIVERRASSPEQRGRRVKDFHGWVLLGLGACMTLAAVIGRRTWFLDVVVAVFCIPVGIAILINNKRSRAGR